MVRTIALKERKAVFLISEEQFLNEKGVEDISNLLNLGEVPNLFE